MGEDVNSKIRWNELIETIQFSRTYLIGGNWKCNGTTASLTSLITTLNGLKTNPKVEVVVAPTFIHVPLALSTLRKDWTVSAQNCGSNDKLGAFTGEIAASQLKDLGCTWVILGHSERREAGESSEVVAGKTKIAVGAGLKVMLCIGEKLEQRQDGTTMDVCSSQLKAAVDVLSEADWESIAIAYEPVWAIGTGVTATPQMAQETHASIRAWMATNVSPAVAAKVRIMYGGSMKGSNAKELLGCEDIDGGLIGGASLTEDFGNVVNGVAE